MQKALTLFLLCTFFFSVNAQQQIINIGTFTTTNNDIIEECKVGFRTFGKLNADKSNVVLWPTWFTGTSEQIVTFGTLTSTIDTTGLYVIIVDALTNGVSSSPSNTADFPRVNIRDMVNSQYTLLVKHLGIDHVSAVIGYSMGGMQAFQWSTAFPNFMDKVIPIIGSPKQSSYDILVWQSMADILTNAHTTGGDMNEALKRAHAIEIINLYSPGYVVNTYTPDSIDIFSSQNATIMKPLDYLGGLHAMIDHDIYEYSDFNLNEANEVIKAELLVIVGEQDHLVNPITAIELAEILVAPLIVLKNNCGHMAPFCEAERVKKAVVSFMER